MKRRLTWAKEPTPKKPLCAPTYHSTQYLTRHNASYYVATQWANDATNYLNRLPKEIIGELRCYADALGINSGQRESLPSDPVLTLDYIMFSREATSDAFFKQLGWSKLAYQREIYGHHPWSKNGQYFQDTAGRLCMFYDAYSAMECPLDTFAQNARHCPAGVRCDILVEQYRTTRSYGESYEWIAIKNKKGRCLIHCHRPNIWIFRLVPKAL